MSIVSNPEQRMLDREDELLEREWVEKQNEQAREHELAVLKLKGENEVQKYKYKSQLASKYKKTLIRAILVLRLFKRKIPKALLQELND